jgi:hypothetical protein
MAVRLDVLGTHWAGRRTLGANLSVQNYWRCSWDRARELGIKRQFAIKGSNV